MLKVIWICFLVEQCIIWKVQEAAVARFATS